MGGIMPNIQVEADRTEARHIDTQPYVIQRVTPQHLANLYLNTGYRHPHWVVRRWATVYLGLLSTVEHVAGLLEQGWAVRVIDAETEEAV
jgi:acyl-ACP thioesterase